MPEPLSSSSSPPANTNFDPFADGGGGMCRADAPTSSQAEPPMASSADDPAPASPAVPKLVSSVSPPPSALPPAASTANNNAQRTSERLGATPYADAGVNGAGDSLYAGVALLKGHDPKSGADVEVLSASLQLGHQTEGQLGVQRLAASHGALSGSVEAFTARANVGIHNDDGSTGLNLGVGATAIGFEGTFGHASSITYGVAASAGAAGSIGLRDIDHDGRTELCARASLGPITVGLCLENPL